MKVKVYEHSGGGIVWTEFSPLKPDNEEDLQSFADASARRDAKPARDRTYPDAPGWTFHIDEISAGVYEPVAFNEAGNRIVEKGIRIDQVIGNAKAQIKAYDSACRQNDIGREPEPELNEVEHCEWPAPWDAIATTEQQVILTEELLREVTSGHVLSDKKLVLVARRIDTDDVLVRIDENPPMYAEAHLTWASPASDARWPRTKLFHSLEDWRQQFSTD